MSRYLVLIDDSPTVCLLIHRLLERAWWRVDSYQKPLEALSALWQHAETPPDAVLLDIHLPQMDGYTIAHLIRTKAPQPLRAVPIIGFSACFVAPSAGLLERARARLVGIEAFLPKPFRCADLFALLSAHVAAPWLA